MKQLRTRLPKDGIAAAEDASTAKHSLPTTNSRLPIGRPPQHKTTVPEFIVRRTGSTNIVGKFLLNRCNDLALWTAARPVLLSKADGRACYRKILVPIDFTETGRITAEFAVACFPYAQIVFLHAFQEPEISLHDAGHAAGNVRSQRLSSQERAIAKLMHLTDELQSSGNLVSRVAQFGSTFSVIANYAARMDADLILVGPQEQLCWKDLLFGSAALRVVNGTSADVLIVPRRMSKQDISPAAPGSTAREHSPIMPVLSSYKF